MERVWENSCVFLSHKIEIVDHNNLWVGPVWVGSLLDIGATLSDLAC
jgi:hypothetical protein